MHRMVALASPILALMGCVTADGELEPGLDVGVSLPPGAHLVSQAEPLGDADPTTVIFDVVKPDNEPCNRVAYHGGHVLDHVKIQNIYWGSYWNDTRIDGGAVLRQKVDTAWQVIGNNRSYFSGMLEYGNYF